MYSSVKLAFALLLFQVCYFIEASAQDFAWTIIGDTISKRSLLFDKEGELWAINYHDIHRGGRTHGIARLVDSNWRLEGNGQRLDTLNELTVAPDGKIWVAGRRIVACFDKLTSEWTNVTPIDSLEGSREFVAICADSSGNIWVSSEALRLYSWNGSNPVYHAYSHVHRFNGKEWITFDITDRKHFGKATAQKLIVDKAGDVWGAGFMKYDSMQAMLTGGFHRFFADGTGFLTFDLGGSPLPDHMLRQVSAMTLDQSGVIWLAYSNGAGYAIERYHGGEWSFYDAFPFSSTQALAVDIQGRLWTAYQGLRIYQADTLLYHFTMGNSPIPDMSIRSIAFANDGRTAVASNTGVSILKAAPALVNRSAANSQLSARCYPNPAHRQFTRLLVSLPSINTKIDVEVCDQLGRAMFESHDQRVQTETVVLPLPALPSGHYSVRISSDETGSAFTVVSLIVVE